MSLSLVLNIPLCAQRISRLSACARGPPARAGGGGEVEFRSSRCLVALSASFVDRYRQENSRTTPSHPRPPRHPPLMRCRVCSHSRRRSTSSPLPLTPNDIMVRDRRHIRTHSFTAHPCLQDKRKSAAAVDEGPPLLPALFGLRKRNVLANMNVGTAWFCATTSSPLLRVLARIHSRRRSRYPHHCQQHQ